MPGTKKIRSVTAGGLEWRDLDSDTPTLVGYASTFNQPYDMGWYTETVIPNAFSKTLSESPDVRLLINHEGLPLGRTRAGTLQLEQDDTGLHVECGLDATDPDVQRVLPKARRGDLNEMSFMFRVIRDTWAEDYTKRLITEISLAGGDVSIVTFPANPNATFSARAQQLIQEDPAKLRSLYARLRDTEQRDGITLSADEIVNLSGILEDLSTIDASVDSSLETLVDILGAERNENGEFVEPDPDDQGEGAGYYEAESARAASTARARMTLEQLRIS